MNARLSHSHRSRSARSADRLLTATLDSPLGPLTAAATRANLCWLSFAIGATLEQELARLEQHFSQPCQPGSHPLLRQTQRELDRYFTGRLRAFSIPVLTRGTAFQQRVWDQLQRIPYGHTLGYADLARRAGKPQAQRAVGQANGRNPIVILIPCHRVVSRTDGLGGYSAGLWRKRWLLDLERNGQPPSPPLT
ncbi:MAG: methylated-DNA--[protein]-cysteine S-methyltransferase [Verrucomicrobia bacterium]|nr:methylated-DNA--[protein]-cysteine S-methyltransferase [Verrucomicrobiota bacterium]